MTIPPEYVAAIEALGYTPDESRFLYLVATYSGYFLPRQFLSFAGCKWGKRTHHFTEKLESRGHATWRQYEAVGVYHVRSKALYRQIDRDTLRHHRRHSTEFVRTRLLLLDFVLANLASNYLESEAQKLNYFCDQLGIPKKLLPAKTYRHAIRSHPSLRYFVDGFPLFFDPRESSEPPSITFSYVDAAQPSLAAFTNYLRAYAPLFRRLDSFRFVYVSDSSIHFGPASDRFASLVGTLSETAFPTQILRYFHIRKRWEARQYATLTNDDLEALNEGQKRFQEAHFSNLYQRWSEGTLLDDALRTDLERLGPRPSTQFTTWLAQPNPSKAENPAGTGELNFTA